MLTPSNSSSPEVKRFEAMSKSEKEIHIASWFIGTAHPIENPGEIETPKIIGDSISFWYHNKLRNCFLREREETDSVCFDERESHNVETLVLSVTQRIRTLVKKLSETDTLWDELAVGI